MLCITFKRGNQLELLAGLLLLPDLDYAVTTSRVKELLGFIRLKHIDVVVVGREDALSFREVGLGEVIQTQVLVTGSRHESGTVVEHGQGSNHVEVGWLQVLKSGRRVQAERIDVVVATSVENVIARAHEGEDVLGLLTLLYRLHVGLS